MSTVGITGTWRTISPEMERDVREAVRMVGTRGDRLVVGGALGVDRIAIEAMLEADPSASRLTVLLATTTDAYMARLLAWAAGQNSPERTAEVEAQTALLRRVEALRPDALIEGPSIPPEQLQESDYLAVNDSLVQLSDELMAFQANGSSGTEDAVQKARAAGKPVSVHSYTV